jgi:heme oxygenase
LKCIASFVADATLDFHGSDDKLVAYEVQGSVQRKEFDALLSEARVFAQALSHTLREAIANKYR